MVARRLACWTTISPHNEHRIAFTRLIRIALFAANSGIWDNLVEAYANTLIYAGMLALLYALLCRGEAKRVIRLSMFVAVVAMGSLPFDRENTFVGFQNQISWRFLQSRWSASPPTVKVAAILSCFYYYSVPPAYSLWRRGSWLQGRSAWSLPCARGIAPCD